jgi:Ribonuclease G/E
MKGRVIALDSLDGREAAALIEDGRLSDLLIDSDLPRPGTIYRAIVERPMKGQGGLFVRTPDGTGFLRQVKGLSPGQPILVQVTGYAEPGKAIPVTARILFKSRFAIVTPGAPGLNLSRAIRDDDRRDQLTLLAKAGMDGRAGGLILRSSCETASDDDISHDIALMADLAEAVAADADGTEAEKLTEGEGPHDLAWRDWAAEALWSDQEGAFADHGVPEMVDALRRADVGLPGGAGMAIEPTRALIAVDVNTGADSSPAAGLKANLACARELPRQLRLRGLGGQVVLDLAPMPKKDRRSFETALRSAMRKDPVETTLVGWTPLGHYEMQRKRDRIPVAQVLP